MHDDQADRGRSRVCVLQMSSLGEIVKNERLKAIHFCNENTNAFTEGVPTL